MQKQSVLYIQSSLKHDPKLEELLDWEYKEDKPSDESWGTGEIVENVLYPLEEWVR